MKGRSYSFLFWPLAIPGVRMYPMGWGKIALGFILCMGLWGSSSPCLANPSNAPEPNRTLESHGKRTPPDFNAREDKPTTVGEALLWVPRVILFPVYLATEYLIRAPLGLLGRTAEQNNWPTQLISFFTFGPDKLLGIFPTFLIDFGFRPSVGLYFFGKDIFSEGNRINFRAATGGSSYYKLYVTDRYSFSKKSSFSITAGLMKRPDYIFHDLGPSSSKDSRSRYTAAQEEVSIGYTRKTLGYGHLTLATGFKNVAFFDGDCCGEPGIQSQINAGAFSSPPGFSAGYSSFWQKLDIAAGHRLFRPSHRVGWRTEAEVEHTFGLFGDNLGSWINWGGALTGFFDINGRHRILSLSAAARFSDPLGGGSVPFTELVSLGGEKPLPGFLAGRLLGDSSLAVTLQYRWPIWVFFDGILHFGVGNVFGKHLDGLSTGLLRKSVGIGMQSLAGYGSAFDIQFSLGSKTFDDGGDFNEFRVLVGISSAL